MGGTVVPAFIMGATVRWFKVGEGVTGVGRSLRGAQVLREDVFRAALVKGGMRHAQNGDGSAAPGARAIETDCNTAKSPPEGGVFRAWS